MDAAARTRTDIEANPVPRPYPGRTGPLPWQREDVTADWLGETLRNKYPGVVAEHLEQVEFIDSHTANIRTQVRWNEAGRVAGLPERMCLKSNFLRDYNNVDICAVEARFYHFLSRRIEAPTTRCIYADWEDDGSAHGLIILEDLTQRGGRFGQSSDHAGVDGVAAALAGLAQLHGSLWDSPAISPENAPWLQTSIRAILAPDARWWVAGVGTMDLETLMTQLRQMIGTAKVAQTQIVGTTAEGERVAVESRGNFEFEDGRVYRNTYRGHCAKR